jgi:hypothetical protein
MQGLLALFERVGHKLDTAPPPELRVKTNVLLQRLENLDRDITPCASAHICCRRKSR